MLGISRVARHACHWFRGGRPGESKRQALRRSLKANAIYRIETAGNRLSGQILPTEPPSTRKLLPAMNDVSSEARNTTIPATSSGGRIGFERCERRIHCVTASSGIARAARLRRSFPLAFALCRFGELAPEQSYSRVDPHGLYRGNGSCTSAKLVRNLSDRRSADSGGLRGPPISWRRIGSLRTNSEKFPIGATQT